MRLLFMGLFLHQTTTGALREGAALRCLWVFSYIKPQLPFRRSLRLGVVYGSFPTSNHNCLTPRITELCVVYGSFPTSNHNRLPLDVDDVGVVYGSFPTSNHNLCILMSYISGMIETI